jgi:DNA invertase Pin-like site-specific DNA recombinase
MGFSKKHYHIKKVLEFYKQGVSKKAIAQKFNLSQITVAKWIKDDTVIKNNLETRIIAIEKQLKIIIKKISNYE